MKARKGGFTLVELLIVIMIIAILAGMMLLATGSATDSAEATRVINDLRGMKGAALLYYGDHMEWPAVGSVANALEPYLDRSIDTNRYDDPRVAGAGEREIIGFTLNNSAVTKQGVRNKLAGRQREAGLLNATGGDYAADSLHVFMNMR